MADDRDAQQKNSFHWPPTSEELESIQVIEVHDDAPGPTRAVRTWWRRMIEGAVIAQVGLAAASVAAIGIAVTSLLAPAQPAAHVAKRDIAPAPIVASSSVPSAAATAPAQASDPSTFRHMVTFDAPPPAIAEVSAERAAARDSRATTSRTSATAASRGNTSAASLRAEANVRPRKPRATTQAARRDAGTDPVSRFAKHTGLSVWKAMRAVGRSFKRDSDGEWSARPATRSTGERRTVAAVNLAADAAPSAR